MEIVKEVNISDGLLKLFSLFLLFRLFLIGTPNIWICLCWMFFIFYFGCCHSCFVLNFLLQSFQQHCSPLHFNSEENWIWLDFSRNLIQAHFFFHRTATANHFSMHKPHIVVQQLPIRQFNTAIYVNHQEQNILL